MKQYRQFYTNLFLLTILYCTSLNTTQAQDNICGAVVTPEVEAYMDSKNEEVQHFIQEYINSEHKRQMVDIVPIKAHIIRQSNGGGGLSEADLMEGLELVNSYYINANMQFELCGEIEYIDNSNYYEFNQSLEENQMTSTYNVANAIDIYFVNSIVTNSGGSVAGYAYYPSALQSGKDVIMMTNGSTKSTTFPHELGHYFGLRHTHGTNQCYTSQELVNGSNCSTTGDRICDTPADPGLQCEGESFVNSNCQYTGGLSDANGQAYNPDTRNIMSYSRRICRDRFTTQQYAAIRFSHENERSYLTCTTGTESDADIVLYDNITVSPHPIQSSQAFTVHTDLLNIGTSTFSGHFLAAIFDDNGDYVEDIQVLEEENGLQSNYHYTNGLNFNTNGLQLTNGIYYIGIFYAPYGGETWIPVGDGDYFNFITVQVGNSGSFIDMQLFSDINILPYPIRSNQNFEVTYDVINRGSAEYSGVFSIDLHDLDGNHIEEIEFTNTMSLCANCHYIDGLTFQSGGLDVPPGEYLIVAWYRPTGGEWEILGEGDYANVLRVIVIESLAADAYENNNTANASYNFEPNFNNDQANIFIENANIHTASDIDYYKVLLPSGYNYEVLARVYDSYSDGDDYTNDVAFSHNNGTGWEGIFDTEMSEAIDIEDGGDVMFEVLSHFEGDVGTYEMEIVVNRTSAAFLETNTTSLSFNAGGTCQSISVSSNVNWSLSGTANWISSITPNSGSGNQTIEICLAENTGTNSRNTSLSLTGGGLNESITITQQGASTVLSVSPTSLSFDAGGTCQSINVSSNVNWSLSSTANWISSITPNSGSGNQTIEICLTENIGTNSRNTSLSLTGGGLNESITITQQGASTVLSASPTSLSFNAGGTCQSINVSSNVNWSLSGTANWISSITPNSGSGNQTIEICLTENTSTNSRNTSLSLTGGGLNESITITQQGASTVLSASPTSLSFNAGGTCQSINVSSNVNWSLSSTANWISSITPNSGSGNQTIEICLTENTGTNSRNTSLSLTGGGIVEIVNLSQEGSSNTNVPWIVTATEDNHTIIIEQTLMSDLNNETISTGDYIGFFYTHNGELFCAGYGQWTGDNLSFPVYGNDAVSPNKNGFDNGEVFKVKVWKNSEEESIDVQATYAQPQGLFSHTDSYADDGISGLVSIISSNLVEFSIPLRNGWNIISSFVLAENPNLIEILTPIADDILVFKDEEGAIVQPDLNINNIGDWNIVEGYKVKTSQETSLPISGTLINPLSTTIPIEEGWQMIAYLRNTPTTLESQFGDFVNNVEAMKDDEGNAWFPEFGINNIGTLNPGKGYKIKAKNAFDFSYMANFMENQTNKNLLNDANNKSQQKNSQYFILPDLNTGNNASIVLTHTVANDILASNDEIGIFTSDDILCGVGVYNNENLAIIMWGDDPTTETKEGLLEDEKFYLKMWDESDNLEYGLAIQFSQGDDIYHEDDVEVIGEFNILTSNEVKVIEDYQLVYYPNPFYNRLFIDFHLIQKEEVKVSISSVDGKSQEVFQAQSFLNGQHHIGIDTNKLPVGMYFLKVQIGDNLFIRKVVLSSSF